MKNPPLKIGAEVAQAQSESKPVVALETSILAHGLPYPHNIETALHAEDRIRSHGAVPATIAVIEGDIAIGLNREEIEMLGTGVPVAKLGRPELPFALAAGESGATTVSSTMICANLAGIEVFATGGIGGVHRNFSQHLDVSQDLHELSNTSVLVVASGVKAILDIPKTLEVLETLGVSVAVFGQSEFPAFWARSSGIPAGVRLDAPAQFAEAFAMRQKLGIPGAMLAANPVPSADAIAAERLAPWIENAIAETERRQISGKGVTPFLLDSIAEQSGGETVAANKALLWDNARFAAQISCCLADMKP